MPSNSTVSMAQSSLKAGILGYLTIDISINEHDYRNQKLAVLDKLCMDVIIGQDILRQHESLDLVFGGNRATLTICGLRTVLVKPPALFANLKSDCKPVAIKSRQYSKADRDFVEIEIQRLLKEDIIEPSSSPWHAQVVVTANERHKKRMVVDYFQTINHFTNLDAYPLPHIDEQINEIAKNRVFSAIDLKDAYYQIPLRNEEKCFTAFEAAGKLYQYKIIPFGVTNGVACFQRVMDEFISNNKLHGIYAYLDNLTVCGRDQDKHDANLSRFLDAAKKHNLKFNDQKCTICTTSIKLLGYKVNNGEIRPDPDRLHPLRDIPVPKNLSAQKKFMGLFAYYSKWIRGSSGKIKPLASNTSFPMPQSALNAFQQLKNEIEECVVCAIDKSLPFTIETDASEQAIAATLNQGGRPVAFFSRSLQKSELHHHPVEKEAYASVEALRHWKHYLLGKHFTLITDEKTVSFTFDGKCAGKIKNDKTQRLRIELASYNFDILYRPGKENVPADSLTRMYCPAITYDELKQLHVSLCHPGITRMTHFLKMKNIPATTEEVRNMTASCKDCAECKPRFHRPQGSTLIKATQPFERLNLDFKGPLPPVSQNKYFLTIIDEYSRFPFAIPCKGIEAQNVINSLCSVFAVFGLPSYIHSDRGSCFMSNKLKSWLQSKNIATTKPTPYNPMGNGQCEKYNGVIWKAITLACRSQGLEIKHWESVLPDALHSIRLLLCTTTNETPHERMFAFARKSCFGESIPSWMSNPGPVLLRCHNRQSKFDPYVEEVELLEANPSYAHIRHHNGRETTVSLRDLAPCAEPIVKHSIENRQSVPQVEQLVKVNQAENSSCDERIKNDGTAKNNEYLEQNTMPLQRSTREKKAPDRYSDQ